LVVLSTTLQAETLFNTKFAVLVNQAAGYTVHRAGGYSLPHHIQAHIQAVFGLHGFPIPRKDDPKTPPPIVNITPAVLKQTYGVSGVTPKAAGNARAVAAFQGEYMADKDLADFFLKYVTNYTVGKDDVVSKYMGDKDEQKGNTEASLDIQYLMGIAPGIKTEFWLYASMDFCGDLENWTSAILANDNAPLVHSVSYGFQGPLMQLHCEDAKVEVIDDNLAKLAAKGISIIVSSGDSGSGWDFPNPCEDNEPASIEYTGTVISNHSSVGIFDCCTDCEDKVNKKHPKPKWKGIEGWTYTPAAGPPAPYTCTQILTMWGGAPTSTSTASSLDNCCEIAGKAGAEGQRYTFTPIAGGTTGTCELFSGVPSVPKTDPAKVSGFSNHYYPAEGRCVMYTNITGSAPHPTKKSGPAPVDKEKLWPSWPASSPWVTAVGGTRFVGMKIGAEEMATDQFGSGGGFSTMFNISDHAQWQADAVKAYLAAAPQLPPAGVFPAYGRATPDVSGLGEGYQVLQAGEVLMVGGTSASAPMFASLISLINDARLQAGKTQMGYLNPWIYKNTDAFTDVVLGNNGIGRGWDQYLKYGFNCTKGWDPVTGVGTPIFDKMMAAAMAN